MFIYIEAGCKMIFCCKRLEMGQYDHVILVRFMDIIRCCLSLAKS